MAHTAAFHISGAVDCCWPAELPKAFHLPLTPSPAPSSHRVQSAAGASEDAVRRADESRLTPYDMKRLQSYASNLVDHHLARQLSPTVDKASSSLLYFRIFCLTYIHGAELDCCVPTIAFFRAALRSATWCRRSLERTSPAACRCPCRSCRLRSWWFWACSWAT